MCLSTEELSKDLCKSLRDLSLEVVPEGFVASLVVQPIVMDRIQEAQKGDKEIEGIKETLKEALKEGKTSEFREDEQGTIWFGKCICVPNDPDLRKLIFQKAHESPYSIHPGNTKMYVDLKERFWWNKLKRYIA